MCYRSKPFYRRISTALWGTVFGLLLLCGIPSVLFSSVDAATLKKYEAVIAKSGELNLYGYDLKRVTLKLKQMTETLLSGNDTEAARLIDEISGDLQRIEVKGPEQMRRERELVWLEIYGDFIRLFAIFVVLSFLLVRLRAVKRNLNVPVCSVRDRWKMTMAFTLAAGFAGTLSFAKYDQSSWAFIDLQLLFVAISGLAGGIWVGVACGLLNALFRCAIAPEISMNVCFLATAGLISGIFHRITLQRPPRLKTAVLAGLLVCTVHSIFAYQPVWNYLPFSSLLFAVLFLSSIETGLFVMFFVFIQQRFREEQQKETERELLKTQLAFLRAQINPHFLFNALNTIASICGDENAERARNLIIQLSALLRRLSKKQGDYVSLQEELEYIDHYLEIEKARFGDKLCVIKDIQLSDKAIRTPIPILMLQPMVENAVKHGVSKKAEGGAVTLRLREVQSKICFEVEDTGVGMSEERLCRLMGDRQDDAVSKDHAGVGVRNIRERLDKLYGSQSALSVTSRPGEGTTVQITFPEAP
jgi:LytS/YehU family sensor histidine kinase